MKLTNITSVQNNYPSLLASSHTERASLNQPNDITTFSSTKPQFGNKEMLYTGLLGLMMVLGSCTNPPTNENTSNVSPLEQRLTEIYNSLDPNEKTIADSLRTIKPNDDWASQLAEYNRMLKKLPDANFTGLDEDSLHEITDATCWQGNFPGGSTPSVIMRSELSWAVQKRAEAAGAKFKFE